MNISGELIRRAIISGDTDPTVVYANSAAANTQNTIDITRVLEPCHTYELMCYNPSTVTDLTVKVFAVEIIASDTRYVLVTTLSIPKSQALTGTTVNAHARLITGIFNGANLRLTVSNDTVLGASDGFTATFRIRELL